MCRVDIKWMAHRANWSKGCLSCRAMAKKSPGDFIKQVLGRPVIVKLNNGADYRGILTCLSAFQGAYELHTM